MQGTGSIFKIRPQARPKRRRGRTFVAAFCGLALALSLPKGPAYAQEPGSGLPPMPPNQAILVPWNWSLIPEELGPGDSFRLLFVTSETRDAMAYEIDDYNSFVMGEAAAGHSDLLEHKRHFRALGSTEDVSARTNTATDPAVDGPGVPIYWLLGPKVADDNSDLYDSSWDHYDPGRKRDGRELDFSKDDKIFTGTRVNGASAPLPLGGADVDGGTNVRVGMPGIGAEFDSGRSLRWDAQAPFYALSGIFRVEPIDPISVGVANRVHGELTAQDGGRDWFVFSAEGGQPYIIELVSRMAFEDVEEHRPGAGVAFVDDHLIDPSILEIVNAQGERVLKEHDYGGFINNFARAFFVPDADGRFAIAVGTGNQDRWGTGHYTLSIRLDDHADDYRTDRGVTLRPGQSIEAYIDSDVSPHDPGLNPWDWAPFYGSGDNALRPRRGIEMLDDRDVFRFEIEDEGLYELTVRDGPSGVGIWFVWDVNGHLFAYARNGPQELLLDQFPAGLYYMEVGTPYDSAGNVGTYTATLNHAQ